MRKLVFMIALLMLAVSGCTGSSPSNDEGSPATPSPTPSRGSVTAPSSTAVPVRNVLVDYGSGRIVISVPLAWSHRSGHIDLHYVQVYNVFSTVALPAACRNTGPGSTECGVRLNVLGAGDAALVVRSGSGLPGSSYAHLKGLPTRIAGREALDLGTSPCPPGTCRTYALPLKGDRWLELSFAQVAPQPTGADDIAAVLRGVKLLDA